MRSHSMKNVLVSMLLAVMASTAWAADIAAGAAKAKQVCAVCHGEDGNGVQQFPDYPKLAGQYSDYLFRAMRDYKNGARKNAIMAPMAQPLSTKEMHDIAAYFASQKGSLHVKR
jgi:cytochrome c553